MSGKPPPQLNITSAGNSESAAKEQSEDTSGLGPSPSPTTGEAAGLSLSTLDKIKRFFFSKEEWEAYLLEKLEEEKRKKGE